MIFYGFALFYMADFLSDYDRFYCENCCRKKKFTKNLQFLFSLDKMSKFELKSIPKLQKMLDIYYIIMYNIFTMKNCHQKYDKTIRRFA